MAAFLPIEKSNKLKGDYTAKYQLNDYHQLQKDNMSRFEMFCFYLFLFQQKIIEMKDRKEKPIIEKLILKLIPKSP